MSYNFDEDFFEFESYKTQLKSSEWRKKRNKILLRDNYTCLKCKNANILNASIPYHFHSDGTNPNDKAQFFGIFLPLDDIKEFYIPHEVFMKLKERDQYLYYWHQSKGDLHLAAIYEIENSDNPFWVSDSLLEVHHTYYELGCRAWEYPDKSLETLCWFCHKETHSVPKVRKKS